MRAQGSQDIAETQRLATNNAEIRLPDGLAACGCSPIFTEETLPAALLKAHATVHGCWAVLSVHAGCLIFIIDDPRRRFSMAILGPDRRTCVIEPTVLHRVAPFGAVEVQIEFFKSKSAGAGHTHRRGSRDDDDKTESACSSF